MDNELTQKANELINSNACILLDRKAWGKDYRATILIPPPHGDQSTRDTEPKQDGVEDYTFYQDVLTMVEGVMNEANKRGLKASTPVVLRTETEIISIMHLGAMGKALANARVTFAVKS